MNIWVQISRVLESMEAPDRSSRYRPESRRLQQVVRHIICVVPGTIFADVSAGFSGRSFGKTGSFSGGFARSKLVRLR